jgi:hypothetical protein
MKKSWLVAVAVAGPVALLLAPATSPQRPAPQRMVNAYADWLVPYVGRDFYLSEGWTVATEKRRTSVVPEGAREFKLSGVGQDFVWFESASERVCVPVGVLRSVLDK